MVYCHSRSNRLGTSPNLISLVKVNKISFAISYLLVFKVSPSNAISASLPQSKNQWYPAIIVCSLVNSLYTTKASVAFTKVSISSFSCFFSVSNVFFTSLLSFTILFTLLISFWINFGTLTSSIFSSNEQIKEISFSSFDNFWSVFFSIYSNRLAAS